MRLIGLSGSLRAGSFNTALLRAAVRLMPEGVELGVTTIHGIPLYDGDAEVASGIPNAVMKLKCPSGRFASHLNRLRELA